jgi:UMF1 family MFS transporter
VPAVREPPRLLARLGLDRPEVRAWVLYDCANSAAVTSIVTAIFPIYYAQVAARGVEPALATQRYAWATTAGLGVVACLAPFLGTVADVRPWKKALLALFALGGALATGALFLVGPGDWALASILFALLTVGLNGSLVFYDALLPHVAREDELDRISSAGYAIGYLGGGLLLAAQLALVLSPGTFGVPPGDATLPSRIAFAVTAVWWAAFSVPLLRRVREPAVERTPGFVPWLALRRLGRTALSLGRHRHAVLMLVAFLVYNDGIGTIIRMATIYGTELGLPREVLIGSILLVQLVGVPCAFAFVALSARVGRKRAIGAGLAVYALVAVLAYFTTSAAHFVALAVLVGLVQGGTQALSRALFASLVPRRLSGEFFGFFAVSEKVAGIFGPGIFALVIGYTGSSRTAILSIIAFFVVGGLLLTLVDEGAGRRAAAEADAERADAGAAPAPRPAGS